VRTDDFWSRLATAGSAVWFYLYKAMLPVNLSFVYPRWQIDAASVWSYVPGLLAAAGLLACWLNRRRWGKAWLFALGYFVVMLLPVLGFLNISFMRYSLVADRWQYFAILGPIALVAAGVSMLMQSAIPSFAQELRRAGRNPQSAIGLKPIFYGALLITLAVLTWRQCATFTDLETLWRTTLARNPKSAMAHTDLANVLIQKGQPDEAVVHYQKALAIEPDYELANYNYGYVLLQRGRVDEAIPLFQKALAVQPGSAPAHYHLGNAFLQRSRTASATSCSVWVGLTRPSLISSRP
jgi:tetratricopeptide (TPR) repeat protein